MGAEHLKDTLSSGLSFRARRPSRLLIRKAREENLKKFIAWFVVATIFLAFAPALATAPLERAQMIIVFKERPNAALITGLGGEVITSYGIIPGLAARVPTGALEELRKNPTVAYIEPDAVVYASGQQVPWGISKIGAPSAWSFSTGAEATVIFALTEKEVTPQSPRAQILFELQAELEKLSPTDLVKVIIHLEEQPLFSSEIKRVPRAKKIEYMKRLTEKSQKPVISALETHGVEVRAKFWIINSIAATLPADLFEIIAGLPGVGRIELDTELQLFSTPPSRLWGFPKDRLAALDVARVTTGADNVHEAGYDGTSIKIGVLDTGIQDDHTWLQRNGASVVIEKWDATVDPPVTLPSDTYRANHGTMVAGVIASQDNTYKGIAPGSDLIDICVMDTDGTIYSSYLVTGIQLAIDRGCDIASVSIGGHLFRNDGTRADSIAFDKAFYYGVLSSIAIGNEGPSTMSTCAPADGRQVISVAAYDDKDTTDIADDIFSSWAQQGPSAFGWFDPDISAPGVDITTSKPVNDSITVSGTSLSTPHVAGVCALVMQKYPNMDPEMVRLAVISTASDMGFHPWTQGTGSADAYSAVMSGLCAGVRDWAIYRDPSAPENIIAGGMILYPFWNVYIQPGHKTKTEVTTFNYSSSEVILAISNNAYADYDNNLKTLSYTLEVADNVTVPANGQVKVPVSIEIPAGHEAGTWPIYLEFSNDNKRVVVPICVTVLLEFTAVSGYLEGKTHHIIDDYYTSEIWGDTFAFGFHNSALNEEEVDAILEWTRRWWWRERKYQDLAILLYNAKRTYIEGWHGTNGLLTATATGENLDTGIWWIIINAYGSYQQGYETGCTITAQEKSGTLLIAATTHPDHQERTLNIYAAAVCGIDGVLATGTINFTLYKDNGDLYWDHAADTATSITGVMSYNSSTSRFENEGIDISSLYGDPGVYYAWCTMTDENGHQGQGGSTFFIVTAAAWQLIETWTGTVEAPVQWRLIETWTGTVSAPAEWQLIEAWTGTVNAPVQWNLIETWTGTVSAPAPAQWNLIETWTGTVSAPVEWNLIETWTGTVSAPVAWQVIETWTGTVEVPAAWQLVETWTGTIETPPWTGTAVFSLVNLYTVNVEKILDLNDGSKLVVKFYTYGDAYENENVIETFVPPAHVEENENARHPNNIGAKKAVLVLTTDNTEEVISTIVSFTVRRSDLMGRLAEIDMDWPYASPQLRSILMVEIADIDLQWPYAPP